MLGLTARKATLGCAVGRAAGWHSLRPPKCCNPKRKETGEDALPRRVCVCLPVHHAKAFVFRNFRFEPFFAVYPLAFLP